MDEIDFIFKLELDEFPHQGLTKIADLIYFEGPLLSLFTNYDGQKYLYYWCDASDVVNRWLVLGISDKRFDLYLRKKISLREVILEPDDGLLHVCDIDGQLRYRNVYVVSPDYLPESYIPDEDSYYEFAPEFMLGERLYDYRENYKIYLDKSWTLQDLSDLPRVYTQAYSFLYSLHQPSKGYSQPETIHKYSQTDLWQGVISESNFYGYLYNYVYPPHRPAIVSMQYAPPGWIELDLFLPTALSIRDIVGEVASSFDKINALYDGIYKFLTEHDLLKREAQEIRLGGTLRNDEYSRQMALESVRVLSSKMKIENVSQVYDPSQNPLRTINILLGFYIRVKKLAEYQIEGKARY